MRIKNLEICVTFIIAFFVIDSASAYTTLNPPNSESSSASDIDGSNIVGYYNSSSIRYGYLYNGSIYTTIFVPGATTITELSGISGDNIVGTFYDEQYHGFIYNGGDYTTLNYPGAHWTFVKGIDGENIIGSYSDIHNNFYYFLYNTTTEQYVDLDLSGSPAGIDGDKIVGSFQDVNGYYHGYLFNGNSTSILDFPGAERTQANGIDGNNIVGRYFDTGWHGFIYDGSNYTTIDLPGSNTTRVNNIDGDKIVGLYNDGTRSYGFIYEIPEPTTLLLLSLGSLALRRRTK
jgi:hypothetical protein